MKSRPFVRSRIGASYESAKTSKVGVLKRELGDWIGWCVFWIGVLKLVLSVTEHSTSRLNRSRFVL